MFVLITGGGRTGTQLALLLIEQDYDICIVEHRSDVLARMHQDLPTEVIYEGMATDPKVLERAGIQQANVVAACTSSDAENLVVSFLARERYGVNRIIARINNPRNAWLFDEQFHVDVALNQSEILASLIVEEMSLGDMMTLLKLRRGEYSLVEEKMPPGAKAIGIPLKDLTLPEECVIAAIIRHGKVVLPRGITTFEEGDEVLAVTNHKGARELSELFAPRKNTPVQQEETKI